MTSAVPATRKATSTAKCLLWWIPQLLLAYCIPAHAAYKCKIDGSLTYTDRPCGSESLTLQASPASRSAVAEDSPDSLHRERAEIARLQRLREQRERQDQQIRDLAARGAAARDRKCKSLSLQLRWREEDVRDATLKEEHKARVRARRAKEKLVQECQ